MIWRMSRLTSSRAHGAQILLSRERLLHCHFVREHFLYAVTLRHALEMRNAVWELGQLEFERNRASETPEEIGVDRREMLEEPLAAGEQIISNSEIL
jgi:hypothetical protein